MIKCARQALAYLRAAVDLRGFVREAGKMWQTVFVKIGRRGPPGWLPFFLQCVVLRVPVAAVRRRTNLATWTRDKCRP